MAYRADGQFYRAQAPPGITVTRSTKPKSPGEAMRGHKTYWAIFAALALFAAECGYGATVSKLYSRGYAAIPEPQKVTLGDKDFRFGDGCRLELASSVRVNDVAVESLQDCWHHGFTWAPGHDPFVFPLRKRREDAAKIDPHKKAVRRLPTVLSGSRRNAIRDTQTSHVGHTRILSPVAHPSTHVT